jgi:hypothetical protein
MTSSQPNQGGMKHYLSKTKKLNHYRRVLRTLKNKNFKTKSAKVRKQHKMQYIKDRIKKLSARRRTRKTARRRVTNEPIDNYISPRVVPIAATGIASQPSISPITISPSAPVVENLPTSISVIPSAPASPIIQSPNVSTAQTDTSMVSAASNAFVPAVPAVPSVEQQVATGESPMGNSLHLSDLAGPSPATAVSENTTKESMSM